MNDEKNKKEIQDLAKKYIKVASDLSIQINKNNEFEKKVIKLESLGQANGKKIDRILSYMENDDATGEKGLVYEVRRNSDFRKNSMTQVRIVATVVSAIFAIIVFLFQKLIIK